jgi:hypothetical protein
MSRTECVFPRNFPELKDLHDQNQNRYRPYSHHCASDRFVRISARSGESTIKKRANRCRLAGGFHVQESKSVGSLV